MEVSTLLSQIKSTGKSLKNNEPGSREALIAQSRALTAALEIPSEFIQRTLWAEPAQSAILRLAADMKLFQHLKDAQNGSDLSMLGVELDMIQRLARHLVAMNVLTFYEGLFHSTTLSDALAEEKYERSILFCCNVARAPINQISQIFNTKRESDGEKKGLFQIAHGTELSAFQWFAATPPYMDYFNSFMAAYRAGKRYWFEEGFYPVAENLLSGFQDGVLLVDVGGGRGHDLEAFLKVYGGRVILQDQPGVIADISAHQKFEAQAHDFFMPQPVVGARAYYLHSVLHNWSDDESVEILKNLIPALKEGYSKVLINEIVADEERPVLAATSMDMMMLAFFGVKERTKSHWNYIIERAGLRIVGIYAYPGVAESLIEVELA
ncbi:hypothetical protein MYU51_008859 [Penicillium brevicompactum]|uniref:uncharacterized protein n=1 Tax=Penicillium brevicompactum TaxID=5074 RepID=UPI00253FC3C2|nr:uncharacterized protein N7506_006683 [Penicillium brevicompactum]KAJ5332900.1 hypothetical protein N7506_006683 [Penicillium brevicompactum]